MPQASEKGWKRINLSVTDAEYELLEKLAQREMRTLGAQVRYLTRKGLEALGEVVE